MIPRDPDIYTRTIEYGGVLHGQVVNMWHGAILECTHSHSTWSTAIACADRLLIQSDS